MTINLPEVNVALNFVSKRSLVVPVDVENIIREFASVKKVEFPEKFDVDGLCLDLKNPGKTRIFINSRNRSKNRLRFTLAHELGHILIPWHIGTILDQTNSTSEDEISTYWQMEGEANRFAAELLMPSSWLEDLLQEEKSPPVIVEMIRSQAQVSTQAALIRLNRFLLPGFVYAVVEDGIVKSSNRSSGTHVSRLFVGSDFIEEETFSWAKQHWKRNFYRMTLHWWHCAIDATPLEYATTDWKNLLQEIVTEIVPDKSRVFHHKQSINGTISAAHSAVLHGNVSQPLFEICMQKFFGKAEHDMFTHCLVSHPRFKEFLTSRVAAFKGQSVVTGP